jgi:hypothetical protein
MNTAKVLTIRQPWAGLIMLKLKNIENRTWSTRYRGKVIIHSSAQIHDTEWMSARYMCRRLGVKFPDGETILGKTGEILGIATLSDILPPPPVGAAFEQEKYLPWQVEGNYGWALENPIQFPITISIKGKLGLWDLPEDTPLPESIKRIIFTP